jgi:NCS1 family nucleobase:cation symporter-1
MVGFWATLSLNIPDFTRYARSQKDQVHGQTIGLPPTMALYSFIGVAVTSASLLAFPDVLVQGDAPWDPVALIARFDNPVLVVVAMFALAIATLTTNIAANVVSPANDFANLAPSKISFKTGGIITGVIGILIMPWKLLASVGDYLFVWLVGYSALLGPIGGIMIADYFIVRKTELLVDELYTRNGAYGYGGSGWNLRAMAILLISVAPNVPGFLAAAGLVDHASVAPIFHEIYTYAWFVGFALGFGLYIFFGQPRVARVRS